MLPFDDTVLEALRTHQGGRTYGIAQYQGRSLEVQIEQSGSLTLQADSFPQATASVHVFGGSDSLVPRGGDDLLAPFGQEISLFREVHARSGVVVATIPLGVYRITSNSNGRERFRVTVTPPAGGPDEFYSLGGGLYAINPWMVEDPPGSGLYDIPDGLVEDPVGSGLYRFETVTPWEVPPTILDWEIDVDLADRFRMLQRGKLVDPKSPVPGNSMYAELRRLSLFPLQVSLPDESVPAGTVYNDRISAVKTLAELTGGVPHLTRQGALTLRAKDRWLTETVDDFDITGTISGSWEDGQSDEFYNYVRTSSPDDLYVGFAQADDDSHYLSVNRAGISTYEHSSPVYTSQQAADAGARTVLARLMFERSRRVSVQCTGEALPLELGDFGRMSDPDTGKWVRGEVCGLRIPFDPTEPIGVDLIVAEVA